MANTYTLIASNTVGASSVSTVTFSSIPSTYTDLVIKASLRSASGVGNYSVTFNGSSSGYSERLLYGTGSTAASASQSAASFLWWAINTNESGSTASTFASNELYIPNYAGSNHKSLSIDNVTENNGTAASAYLDAGLWANTAAITSIALTVTGGAGFVQYSSFYLYGIKNS